MTGPGRAGRVGHIPARRVLGATGVVVALALGAVVASLASGASLITEYSAGLSAGAGPNVIAKGPDGAMWFSEYQAGKIGRIAADGSITTYPSGQAQLTASAEPSGLVAGPDGNIWFTEYGAGKIGDIDPSTGALVGEYPLPAGISSQPEGIVVGPDGALWVTERGAGKIGRLDPATVSPGTSQGIKEFSIPFGGNQPPAHPVDLIDGPNGTIWVTLLDGRIASVVPTGSHTDPTATIALYPLPTANSQPEGIALGSDNKLWVAEYGASQFAEIDPGSVQAGTSDGITEYPAAGKPLWLAQAGDGALWATDNTDSELIRFDRSTHTTTIYGAAQGVSGDATTDAADAGGNLWFTEFNADKIGKVATAAAPHTLTVSISGTGGGTITGDAAPVISCPSTCQQQYPYGTTVTLTEAPNPNTIFLGWNGACTSSNTSPTCKVTLTADLSAGAQYQTLSSGPPPKNLTPPHITGTPKFGESLTCTGDTWSYPSGWPLPHLSQYAWFEVQRISGSHPVRHATTQIATGRTITLGDYPPGATVYCTATAHLTTTSVQSPSVTVLAVVPAVAVQFGGGHSRPLNPTIDPTVFVGSTNTCSPGTWLHHPTSYAYAWYVVPTTTSPPSDGRRVGIGAKLHVHAIEELGYLVCAVTARNEAGEATALSNRYYVGEPDLGFQVDGIEITQGIQTSEVPTATASNPYVSYQGVALPWSNGQKVKVLLAEHHATVIRVYISSAQPVAGHKMPGMTLTAYRDGHALGAIGPDTPPGQDADQSGTAFAVAPASQSDPTGAYTFGLPWDWTTGDVSFKAQLTAGCLAQCLARRIVLGPEHFNPVTSATIYPIAFTSSFVGPQGYSSANPVPDPDPQWSIVQEVVPFPIYIQPYTLLSEQGAALSSCDGVTQPTGQSNPAFAQAVYAARDATLLSVVSQWASQSSNTSSSIYPFGVVPSAIASQCTAVDGTPVGVFSGGLTSAGAALYSSQPVSVSSDDRPLTGIAHEFNHGVGLVHAGVQCGSGTVGTSANSTATSTAGSKLLSGVASPAGLVPGQPITGPGVPAGTLIAAIAGATITMIATATATNANASYAFGVGGSQTGELWPPTFVASTGQPADGLLDGLGLVGLGNPAKSPYAFRGPAVPGVASAEIYDLMSYCHGGSDASAWISVRNWNRDVAFHAPAPTKAARSAAATASYSTSPPASTGDARTLAVTSVYSPVQDRTFLTDVLEDSSAPTAATPGATYSLTARDAAGNVVATAGTDAETVHVDGASGLILIRGKIAAPSAREVDVLSGGRVIAQDHASPNAPTVTLLEPKAGERLGGPHGAVIRWHSNDADGDQLDATVDYSSDGGHSWRTIYRGPDSGSARLPGDLLSGSRNALLRIYISDGFNEAIATSPRFISLGVPPHVVITEPTKGIRRPAGASVNLSATAYDDTGTRLTGRSLVWRAGRHVLGRGAMITTTSLPAGRQRVTLTARDRHGRTATASVTVTILPSTPQLTLLRAPHRVGRQARSLKFRIALLAPATLTIGGHRYLVGRSARTVSVAIRPGRKPFAIALVLRSGPYVFQTLISVAR